NRLFDYFEFDSFLAVINPDVRSQSGPSAPDTSLFYLEAAGRGRFADAMFLHWRANYLSEQRFCQQTRFGMIRGGSSNWTAVAVDKMFSIFFAKACRSAEFLKDAQRGINSLLASFTLQ